MTTTKKNPTLVKAMGKKSTDKQGRNSEGVGYKKPPKAARWKPGQSGNPKGRPKCVTLSETLRGVLAEAMPGKSNRTYGETIARMLCKQAAGGNVAAAREVFDRTEGRPRQAIEARVEAKTEAVDMREEARDALVKLRASSGLSDETLLPIVARSFEIDVADLIESEPE